MLNGAAVFFDIVTLSIFYPVTFGKLFNKSAILIL